MSTGTPFAFKQEPSKKRKREEEDDDVEVVEKKQKIIKPNDWADCPICMETYAYPMTLPCDHTFCSECTIKLSTKGECPTCRKPFNLEKVRKNRCAQRMILNAQLTPKSTSLSYKLFDQVDVELQSVLPAIYNIADKIGCDIEGFNVSRGCTGIRPELPRRLIEIMKGFDRIISQIAGPDVDIRSNDFWELVFQGYRNLIRSKKQPCYTYCSVREVRIQHTACWTSSCAKLSCTFVKKGTNDMVRLFLLV